MTPNLAIVWYLVVAGPQGGLTTMPDFFDTRDECKAAITEYQKEPAPAGWSVNCLPSASPYSDEGDDNSGDDNSGTDDGSAG